MKDKKELDHSLKLIVKSSFIVFIGIILSKIFSYAYTLIIARDLGPEIYGLYSLAFMIFTLVASIASLGLQDGLSRYIPFYRGKRKKEEIKYTFRFSVNLAFYFSVVLMVLFFLLSNSIAVKIFHNQSLTIYLKWFAIFLPILTIGGFYHLVLRAYEKIGIYSFIGNILQNAVKLILLILLMLFGLKGMAVILSNNLGVLSLLIAAFWVCRYQVSEIFKKSTLSKKYGSVLIKELFNYSWPLILIGVISFLFSWVDSFVIGYFLNISLVGIYNVAVSISSLLLIAPALFVQLFFPLVTKQFAKKEDSLVRETSKQVAKWIFILNLPLLILSILFPGALIHLLFGSQYMGASTCLRFLSIGLFFYAIFTISQNLLSTVGKSKAILANLVVMSIFNLILNIILVPKYGINGAAFSTMLSYILWSLISMFQCKKYTSIIPIRRKMLWVLVVSVIPTAILFSIRGYLPTNTLSLILQGLFFVLLYLALVLFTGNLDRSDLMIVSVIKKRFLGNKWG